MLIFHNRSSTLKASILDKTINYVKHYKDFESSLESLKSKQKLLIEGFFHLLSIRQQIDVLSKLHAASAQTYIYCIFEAPETHIRYGTTRTKFQIDGVDCYGCSYINADKFHNLSERGFIWNSNSFENFVSNKFGANSCYLEDNVSTHNGTERLISITFE
jgi:hypothetical protein